MTQWKSECDECNRLWANYAVAILQNIGASKLGTLKSADQEARRTADSAWACGAHDARKACRYLPSQGEIGDGLSV